MRPKNYLFNYTKGALFGLLLGVLIVIAIYVAGIINFDFALNFGGVKDLHRNLPFIYLIDFIPLALGVLGFFVYKKYSEKLIDYSETLEKSLHKERKLYRFVEKLREGDVDAEYTPDENDSLGKAIVSLRNDIKQSRIEEQKRKEEDKQRNWAVEGMALFGDILRQNNDNLEELTFQVIKNLVNYVGANQAAFYLVEDDDESDVHFRMTACYAYERRKYADKIIPWGDGLVGACALEKEKIILKKIPQGYLNITSGLGKANPKYLVLVPLKMNDKVHGVIELASFDPLEDYKEEFIDKVAESVATTIATVKINIRTAKLLKESREQAEELALKEEQMRQNMEELQATQEEASRQSAKFISFSNSVNHTMIRADFGVDGTLLYANTKFLQKLEYASNSDVEGKHISMFINKKDREWFDDIWNNLSKGGKHFEGDMKLLTRNGDDLWTIATFTCVRTESGGVDKILFLAIDTTEQKQQSLDYEGQISALNRSSIKAEFSPTGDLIDANEKFLLTLSYNLNTAKEKSIFELVSEADRKNIERVWDDVIHGIPYEGQFRMNNSNGEVRWFRCTFTAVNDMYDEIAKVILIANDITREKLMEIETQKQTEQLKRQEEQLRRNEIELNKKLREAKEEVRNQFKEIEKVKIRNEKTLEGFLDAIVTTDHDGIVQFFNKAAEELFEISREKVIGQSVRMLFPEEVAKSDPYIAAYIDPNKEKITGQRKEVTIITKSGNEIPVLMLITEAKVGREITHTAFIQNISVDLF
ncbi:PAS domain S-box protein [Tenuifilum thalassicum]|uniref:PAS domain-containing protein n=1 Tax=Tenuifilum thalassicum TaxID=2590900 RepID=A0A7D3XGK0_9BACT|nr:PAS domain-containing protein [Tenuifilum thalassicum]QKG80077.1 PAS domain-containing protein [Tenuifilum thalassicum]